MPLPVGSIIRRLGSRVRISTCKACMRLYYGESVLSLIGQTYDGKVTVTADLGAATDSPFVMGNYSQTVGSPRHNYGSGAYVFTMEIPLIKDKLNGTYPIVLKADYLDALGKKAAQEFKLNVTITDDKTPPDPNEVVKVEVEKPELFIPDCDVTPALSAAMKHSPLPSR